MFYQIIQCVQLYMSKKLKVKNHILKKDISKMGLVGLLLTALDNAGKKKKSRDKKKN